MADSTKKTTRGSRSRSTSSGAKRSTSASTRKRTTASRSKSSGGARRSQASSRSKQQQRQQQPDTSLSKGKLVALGATVGGLTGAALLIRKLRNHDEEHDEDEEYDEDEDEEDEPRSRHDDEDEEDDDYEEDDEDEEDEPQARRSSGRSHDDDRGLASTLWEAVVDGVRSSQSTRREKASRGRGHDYDDEEDDDSDRGPRGASKTERGRAATRAPRGRKNGDDGKAMDVVRHAKHHLVELTGHEAESVSGLERDGDGRMRVRLEVLELERIPRTTDVLASYELTLDEGGQLVDCTRVGRYTRSSAEAGAT